MTEKKTTQETPQPADEQDVEGHGMFLDPTLARDVARLRSRDIDREVRDRNRAKEAKR